MATKKNSTPGDKTLIRPLLALPNFVLTPMIAQPVRIDDEQQRQFIDKCKGENCEIFIVSSFPSEQDPEKEELADYGILCVLDRVLEMPGAPSLAFVRPLHRAKYIDSIYSPSLPMARISILQDVTLPKKVSADSKLIMERIEDLFKNCMHFAMEPEKLTAEKIIEENSSSPVQHLYAITHVAPITTEDKYAVLSCSSFKSLIQTVASILDITAQKISIQAAIHEKTHQELNRQQKEIFLRTHLKHVKEELGETDEDDITELLAKANLKKWDEKVERHFQKEIQKLRRLNINNPEYSVQYSYLESLLDLPWNNYKETDFSLGDVERILNRDHYGLEKVKERILEYMAVIKLRNDLKAPILCLYGPPGVGKTSIGKSVAEATGREYARISLGGMHDEAEIRGHRRTYIGAMPGRFLHSLSKLEYGNPMMLLDEIDKVGKDYKGDPSYALLEALDPEQNNTFHDNFVDFPYDLSKVLFIATANDLSTIPAPLRDRMEVIEISGYTLAEKREIALRHLVGQALKDNGFKEDEIKFSPEAIETIIRLFTHEAGVRQLKMQISKVIRKLAVRKVKGENFPVEITGKMVSQYLDKKDSSHNRLGFRG